MSDRYSRRWPIDGPLLLRSRGGGALARHVHDPRPSRPRSALGPAASLPGLLGRRLEEDGLQGAVPPARAARHEWLGANRVKKPRTKRRKRRERCQPVERWINKAGRAHAVHG